MTDRFLPTRRHIGVAAILVGLMAGGIAAHALGPAAADDASNAARRMFARPAGIPFPADNPYSAAKAELGRRLFFERRLSGGDTMACAGCHVPALGFEDGRKTARGERGQDAGRHTPTLWNVAWGALFFWDGRAASLEEQALGPIVNPLEMDQDLDALVWELSADPDYAQSFAAAFPDDPAVSARNLARAIATFERTLVSPETPFDRWVAGDEASIGPAAKRGLALFVGKANCATCHSGWNFTDDAFHDIGLSTDDPGRGAILGAEELRHAFKTPSLRAIGRRAPYMHDGSLSTLDAVLDHYERGIVARPSLSPDLRPIALTPGERTDLLAFLATLDAPDPAVPGAPRVIEAAAPSRPGEAPQMRVEVRQRDKRFDRASAALDRGGLLVVHNDDVRVHNIRIFDEKLDFNSGIQKPGESVEIRFPDPGSYRVFCGIHPKMELTITVE